MKIFAKRGENGTKSPKKGKSRRSLKKFHGVKWRKNGVRNDPREGLFVNRIYLIEGIALKIKLKWKIEDK